MGLGDLLGDKENRVLRTSPWPLGTDMDGLREVWSHSEKISHKPAVQVERAEIPGICISREPT